MFQGIFCVLIRKHLRSEGRNHESVEGPEDFQSERPCEMLKTRKHDVGRETERMQPKTMSGEDRVGPLKEAPKG